MLKVLTDERCKMHEGFTLLTERPTRLKALDEYFISKNFELENKVELIEPTSLRSAHSTEYVDTIRNMSKRRTFGQLSDLMASARSPYLQYYMRVMADTYTAALASASLSIKAGELILKNQASKVFSANRPPGHHASIKRGEGFCLFNNAALCALHLADAGLRVAVIDFDHHHGNGTENILLNKKNPNVLFISSFWENCKYAKKEQIKNSQNNIRVPLRTDASYNTIIGSYNDLAFSQLKAFNADVLVFSAGFDMHCEDPLSSLDMRSKDYFSLTQTLIEQANTRTIISILEGGYEISALVESVDYHLDAIIKA